MHLKRFISVSACAVVLLPAFASAGDGLEAAKAGSGSSFAEMSAGRGLSAPGSVRASLGLKRYGAAFSAPVKKDKTVKVPAPRSAGSSPASQSSTLRSIMTTFAASVGVGAGIGAGIGALVGGPAGAALGASIGAVAGAVGSFVRTIFKYPPQGPDMA